MSEAKEEEIMTYELLTFEPYDPPPRELPAKVHFSDLVGHTLNSVQYMTEESHEVIFTSGPNVWLMNHEQDCCESVYLDDVVGNPDHIVGYPIVSAIVTTSHNDPRHHDMNGSHTWTFYYISTVRGTVTLKWYGGSNGYYSEEVDFTQVEQ